MSTRNGTAAQIAAYVKAHPGCLRRDILAALGVSDERWAMPSYCRKIGLIFAAGPRGSQRYYPTAEQAQRADAYIRKQVADRTLHKRRQNWRTDNLRKMQRRHADGGRSINTRPGQQSIVLPPGVTLHPEVCITIAPAPRWRWE